MVRRISPKASMVLFCCCLTIATTRGFARPLVASRHLNNVSTSNSAFQAVTALRGGGEEREAKGTKSASVMSVLTVPVLSFAKFYGNSLAARPIATKSATAGFIFALSDYLAQKFEGAVESGKFNWTRMWTSAAVGFIYFGPAAHFWYDVSCPLSECAVCGYADILLSNL